MNNKLYNMLHASATADLAKAELTLELLDKNAVGIGDHSTGDFYKNAEEALGMLVDARDRLDALEKYYAKDREDGMKLSSLLDKLPPEGGQGGHY